MRLSQVQNSLAFTQRCDQNCIINCRPKPRRKPTYGQLAVENAILRQALRDASRIIALDMYVRSGKNKN